MTCIHYCRSQSSVGMRPVENVPCLPARHRGVFVFVEVGSGDPNPTPSEMNRQAKARRAADIVIGGSCHLLLSTLGRER